jgi:ribosomal protein S20
LEEAYERSGGEKEFVKKKIKTAIRAVGNALQAAYKYKSDHEIAVLVKELAQAVEELKKVISKHD